jgi:hypothetical protein
MEHSGECRQQRMPLLLHGRKITADAAKSGGTSRTAKGASNLLLNFRHPQVALRLVVRKRNPQVVEKGQNLLGSWVQLLDMVENSSSLCKSSLGWFFRQCAVRTSYLTLE